MDGVTTPETPGTDIPKFIDETVRRLDLCGLGRGVTVSSVQRFYRVNYSDAVKLLEVRAACFDALDELRALDVKGGAQ